MEAKFVCDLMAKLELSYNIDPARVYITGYSNGGGMAPALACSLPRRVGAVGAVAAGARSLSQKLLQDSAPMPLIAWAQRDGCDGAILETQITADISRLAYGTCSDHADVILYTVSHGGHSWPGGKALPEWYVGRTNNEINASSLIWDFFVQHPSVSK